VYEYSYTEISGNFVKISNAYESDIVLERNSQNRPAARYNRLAQEALYLSVNESSARVAMEKYVKEISSPLVLVEYEVELCQLVDLRHANSQKLRAQASLDWQTAAENGSEPSSWRVSDKLRKNNEIGLIDPSRKNPNMWHIVLFRWNEVGAPAVKVVGKPKPVSLG